MTSFDLNALTRALKIIARRAGQIELDFYAKGTDVMHKNDGSPVTAADEAAEAMITKALLELTPSLPIVAEEAVAANSIPDISGGNFWLVDPLDGTKEFIKRTGDFTVNIALMHNFKPILGVIYAPVFDELYVGHGAGTATVSLQGAPDTPIHMRTPDLEKGLTVISSRSHAGEDGLGSTAVRDYLSDIKIASFAVRGSSLKFGHLARGLADFYPRLAPTSEWDTAAGEAIMNAAGGVITKLDGSPMIYGKTEEKFLNPKFIAHHRDLKLPHQK
jgi:3'(2'), 5'-bisphosphate nucleotidase